MRRIGALLLCFCLLLSGCGKVKAPPVPAEVPVQTVPVEIPEEAPPTEEKQEAAIPPPAEEVPVVEEAPVPQMVCTISVCCKKALEYEGLAPTLEQILPEDGWLLPATEVSMTAGESVFDILLRTVRQKELHMEFAPAAVYGSAYIEGIGGLYEFDCGGESGWIYTVNGESPNVGCSSYAVSDGDIIVWEYVTERT